MLIVIVIILIVAVLGLILYNFNIHKKIQTYKNINQKINNLSVVQNFMSAIGETSTVDEKIKKINDILIEKYEIKYSTIVVFNGAEYEIKASNVDEKHWDALKNLHTEEMFKDSISSATPKYVTINSAGEKLAYQKSEMGRAKSAMFFPLYIDNIYIGYWIIESSEPHAFDNMDTNVLGVVRENIVSVLKTVSYQNTIENIYRVDKTTGLNSAEYLYGKGKRVIDKYAQSTICMFNITNIMDINEKFGRDAGTKAIIDISNIVKSSISSQYIFVRYMGPKFAIAFSGVDLEGVEEFIKTIKEEIEKISIKKEELSSNKRTKKRIYVHPKTNFILATYYKGTGLEEVTKKLEEYLDDADVNESNINCI